MKDFNELFLKSKIIFDHYLSNVSNSFKVMFCIEKMNITSPKEISNMLNIAKSNLTILVGKLRLQKYVVQEKINKKEIKYSLTELGKEKLEGKIAAISVPEKDKKVILDKLRELLG